MIFIIAVIVFGLCVFLMAIGLILAKKSLQKNCSTDPESCGCKKEGKDPSNCENS